MTNDKFQPGDKIHVEFEIGHITQAGMMHIKRSGTDGCCVSSYIAQDNPAIVQHMPAPWVPAVGDKVKYLQPQAPDHTKATGVVAAVENEWVWVLWGGGPVPRTTRLMCIERVVE